MWVPVGGYVILKDRLPDYIVPDLTGFKVCLYSDLLL